jgi:acetate kinase
MDDYSVVLNAGSSSLKFCVYRKPGAEPWRLEARGQIEGIGTSPRFSAKDRGGHTIADHAPKGAVDDARQAFDVMAAWLRSRYSGVAVRAVGHRVVHGGATYSGPTIVTPMVLTELRRLMPLAPLHQPYNLAAIEAVSERLPGVPQVACFDTSFHRGRPLVADVIPLPLELAQAGVQRYGFHGLSYEYVTSVLPQIAPDIARGRLIVAHLGSGASLCAVKNGKSVDSTMGFTALDGLCMGTRPGAVDPGVILHLFQSLELSAKQVEAILYKKSGLLGISGISNDMRTLLASNEPSARLAIDYFVYRVVKEIGALAAVLGGVDGLIFTAGIGENSAEIRSRICRASGWLGIELDDPSNEHNGPRISRAGRGPAVWVIPTNEELMIAKHTAMLLGLVEAPA